MIIHYSGPVPLSITPYETALGPMQHFVAVNPGLKTHGSTTIRRKIFAKWSRLAIQQGMAASTFQNAYQPNFEPQIPQTSHMEPQQHTPQYSSNPCQSNLQPQSDQGQRSNEQAR